MKVDIYDTYAISKTEQIIHFDVVLASPSKADTAYKYALNWLKDIGEKNAKLSQSRCNYCHSESASPFMINSIETNGFYIIQMEGCPNPL